MCSVFMYSICHQAQCSRYALLLYKSDDDDYSCSPFSDLLVCFFLRLLAMLDEDEEDRVDETALQQLTEMGFPESRAIKALRLNQ